MRGHPVLDLVTASRLGGPRPGYDDETDALHLALCGSYSRAFAEVVELLIAAGAPVTSSHHATFIAESVPSMDGGFEAIRKALGVHTPPIP
jgi:hypothetical protein